MPLAYIFWGLMIAWFLFGLARPYWGQGAQRPTVAGIAGDLLLFVVVCCLGYAVFGSAIK